MGANGTTRVSTIEVVRYEGGDLYSIVKQLVSERRTGKMILNLSQGGIGSLEWQGTPKNYIDKAVGKSVAFSLGK